MRRVGTFLALLGLIVASSPGAASARATMSVTPSTGLTPDQTVSVSFAGLPAGIDVSIVECISGRTVTNGCDGSTAISLGNAGADGSLTAGYTVHRGLRPGIPGSTVLPLFDCASKPSGCHLLSFSAQQHLRLGTATIDFDPTIVIPSITIDEPRPLQSHETVHVVVHDLVPGAQITVDQCALAFLHLCGGAGRSGVAAGDGTFAVEMVLADTLEAYRVGSADCAVTAQCAIAASVSGSTDPIYSPQRAIVVERPGIIPTLDVSPLGTYHDRQRVAFSGEHWLPNFAVQECVLAAGYQQCSAHELRDTRQPGGQLTGSLVLQRFLVVYVHSVWRVVDCRQRSCALIGGELGPFAQLSPITTMPLTFDASGVAPSPTISVRPNHKLPRTATVHAHGTGFVPGSGVDLLQCVTGVTRVRCDSGQLLVTVNAAGDGTVDADVAVQRVLPPSSGGAPVDCAAVACAIVASSSASGTAAVALAFAGNPLPSADRALLGPTARLVDIGASVRYHAGRCPAPSRSFS